MKIHQCKDYEEVSKTAADWFIQKVKENPLSKIGIATGNSPLEMYRHISKTASQHTTALSLFQLDEWVGLSKNQHSCRSFIEKEVRIPWGIPVDSTHYFSPSLHLTSKIQAEPGEKWPPNACYVSALAPSTQNHTMILSEQTPPTIGVTLGIKSILQAKEILFIVTATGKTAAYTQWLTKEITPSLPASILWKHPKVTLVTDL